jgi:hypothetical protein
MLIVHNISLKQFTRFLVETVLCESSSSSAHYSPLLDIGLPNFSPSPSIVTPPGLRASYTTLTETRSLLQNSFTPVVVGSTADMASPLQYANTVCYVRDFRI